LSWPISTSGFISERGKSRRRQTPTGNVLGASTARKRRAETIQAATEINGGSQEDRRFLGVAEHQMALDNEYKGREELT